MLPAVLAARFFFVYFLFCFSDNGFPLGFFFVFLLTFLGDLCLFWRSLRGRDLLALILNDTVFLAIFWTDVFEMLTLVLAATGPWCR